MSSPRLPTCLPGETLVRALRLRACLASGSASTHSAGSTASAPAGIGAPVMMRTAWPRMTLPLNGAAGSESPITVSGIRL
jgi:hypothetical protein